MSTIRARFRRGVLEPLEKVDLPEGKEVTVTVRYLKENWPAISIS